MPRAATTSDPFNAVAEPRRRQILECIAAEVKRTGSVPSTPELRLKPGTRLVREWQGAIHEVTVLLEIATGFVQRAQTIDTDGDRMVLSFSKLQTNTGLKDRDLEMEVPAGVSVTRPLEAGGASGDETGQGKRK